MLSRVVCPPQAVRITGFGSDSLGMLVEWRKRKRQGREEWAGVIVHVVNYRSQDGQEWSIRIDVLSEGQFRPADTPLA